MTVLGPAEQTEDLIDQIEQSDAPEGAKNSLTAKLDVVQASAEHGNTRAACNALQAFKREVVAQTPRIGLEQATALLEEADAIAAALGC